MESADMMIGHNSKCLAFIVNGGQSLTVDVLALKPLVEEKSLYNIERVKFNPEFLDFTRTASALRAAPVSEESVESGVKLDMAGSRRVFKPLPEYFEVAIPHGFEP